MIELFEVILHYRLHQSPPLITRIMLGAIAGILTVSLLSPWFVFVRQTPPQLLAIAAGTSRTARQTVSRTQLGTTALALGMLVGATFEAFVAFGEQIHPEQLVVLNEITIVDLVSWLIVSAMVFTVGLITSRAHGHPIHPAYRQWLVVSVVSVGILLWILLIIYELLGILGAI